MLGRIVEFFGKIFGIFGLLLALPKLVPEKWEFTALFVFFGILSAVIFIVLKFMGVVSDLTDFGTILYFFATWVGILILAAFYELATVNGTRGFVSTSKAKNS